MNDIETINDETVKTEDVKPSKPKTMEVVETCPHCDTENTIEAAPDQMIGVCSNCGKRIVLCDKCMTLNTEDANRHCDNCKFCDLANFMNYLKGFCTIEEFLASLNPPLTDMTIGIPGGVKPTLNDYIYDTYGEGVDWDVKYWGLYYLISDCFLNENSTEEECRDFVQEIIERNNS